MTDRRELLLDAAITVLGTRGLRQLTHRAVDAEAGLPEGSTSNMFRTREALISGVLDRLVELETAAWQRLASGSAAAVAGPGPGAQVSPERFAALVATMMRELVGEARQLTLARHAIFHEAAFHPGLQERIAASQARLAEWGVPWLARLGSAQPESDYRTLLGLIDGLLLIQLASPVPDFDPEPSILVMLRGLGGGDARSTRSPGTDPTCD
ncbi:MAG TPA: TetR family transcriptional regulator [Micromonosporaceae bacterium]